MKYLKPVLPQILVYLIISLTPTFLKSLGIIGPQDAFFHPSYGSEHFSSVYNTLMIVIGLGLLMSILALLKMSSKAKYLTGFFILCLQPVHYYKLLLVLIFSFGK